MIVVKTWKQIQKMRDAGRLNAQVLAEVGTYVRPGVTTIELDRLAERLIRDAGALPTFKGYHGYPATLCTSVNEQVVHGIPGRRVLQPGDILSIDCGVTLGGWIGDMAVTLPVGDVAEPLQRLLTTTREALALAIRQCIAGRRLEDVSSTIQNHAESNGYSVVRDYCGHGLGASLHEEPQVPNFGRPGKGPRLKPGWCLAIEPMVNLGGPDVRTLPDDWTVVTADHKPSAHFEHSVAILQDGPPLVLTALDDAPMLATGTESATT